MSLHQFLFALLPYSHCTLGFNVNLGDPFVFFLFSFQGCVAFQLGREIGGECIDCEANLLIFSLWILVVNVCVSLDFALGECTWLYGFRVSEVICIKVQLFQILEL
jgi:hypothetical protein